MVKPLRLKQMEEYILENDVVSMEELCKLYGISMNTLRMDIAYLVDKGNIKKIYGGVSSNRSAALLSFEDRELRNIPEKRSIGRAAASFIEDGDIIYVDSGTTAMYLMEYVDGKKQITILTHSLSVLSRARGIEGLTIYCLGGKLQPEMNCLVGSMAADMVSLYNIGKAFMGTKGITAEGAVTDSSAGEFELKKRVVQNSAKIYLLADSSKYEKAGLMTYLHLDKVDCLITDQSVSDGLKELCKNFRTELISTEP